MTYYTQDIKEMVADNQELNGVISNDIQQEFFICENIKIYKRICGLAIKLDIYITYCDVSKLVIKFNKECMKIIHIFNYGNNQYAKELLFGINDSQIYFENDEEL